jgi:DNA-binding PucR family transcriptional regulator
MAGDSLNSAALRSQGVGSGLVPGLERTRQNVAALLRRTVSDEVTAYGESSNPEVVPELHEHLDTLLAQIIHWLDDSRTADVGFVQSHAERRAAQKFPLEALLHTYRCIHRPLFEWVRDAAVENAAESAHIRRVVAAAADFAIECTDRVSTTATASYVNFTRMLAEAEGDRRAELLNILLQGYDESDPRAAQLLRRSGYLEQRQSYCVVAARSVNPEEMQNAARAQRMADAIGEVLARTPMKTLVGIRDNFVVAIVSGTRRQSGWTAPQTVIADRLYSPLRLVGPAALIGMSNDVPATSHIPRAAAEALCALEFASVAERIKPYSTVSLRQRLVAIAREDSRATLPVWLKELRTADTRGRLAETVHAYANADMNVQQAAKALAVHPNTIYARAQRIEDITGKSLLSYNDLTELLLAVECGVVDSTR